MKLETFFEKFGLFADAPDAVATMRELVLQLAVQGVLVDQKPSDGKADQLLSAIFSERETRAAKLRTPNEPASADGNEPAFPIPSNWAWTRLGNIALQIQYGYTASADPSATEVRMLRITDIQNNRVDWPSVPGCQIESDEAERYLLSPNDILIARTGGTIGKSFIVPDAPVKSVFASYLIRVTPPRAMVSRYLKTFLESPLYWTQLRQMSAGTGQPNVNGQALGRLAIPLPPLAEQKRIVAKVDELMALCDRLEAQQRERETRHATLARASLARFAEAPRPANLQFLFHKSYDIAPADLRKSILTLAVQGKLVPQDPNDDPVHDLPMPRGLERDLHEIPVEWAWTTWEGVLADGKSAFKRGPFGSSLRKSDFVQSGYKVYEQYCPINDDCSYVRYYITPEKFESMKSFAVQEGDFLISCSGVTLGRITQVPPVFEAGVINQALLRVRINSDILDAIYFKMLFRSPFFQDRIFANSTGSAIPNVKGVKDLKAMPIPIPPLAEQRRIVAKVDELMALVDALETQLAASRTTATKLLEALVAELTAASSRDRTANPAAPNSPAIPTSHSSPQRQPRKTRSPLHAR